MKNDLVLVINCGSSSIKFSILNPIDETSLIIGLVDNIGKEDSKLIFNNEISHLDSVDHETSLKIVLEKIKGHKGIFSNIKIVGHRVVHGGEYFHQEQIINIDVLKKIKECIKLAPLHNPANIYGIDAAMKLLPETEHVAVFDTAFHQSMPEKAFRYAISYELYKNHGIRKYGFHGTSHEFVSNYASLYLKKDISQSNFISMHLGNGASIVAIKNGKSFDTTMGLTPLEGLIMGTRSGSIDPEIPLYLIKELGHSPNKVSRILNKESGLLGISGKTHDMRKLIELAENGHENSKLAIEMFCYTISKYIGSYYVILPKIDSLIFTGGIGENSHFIRKKIVSYLEKLNYKIDDDKNKKLKENCFNINKENHPNILVVKTNEELMIARKSFNLLKTRN